VAKDLRYLLMRGTSLKTNNAIKIIQSMRYQNIITLDLSNNPQIGKQFYDVLGEMFLDSSFRLENLILEGNNMKDKGALALLDKVVASQTIKVINLSNNKLSDKSVPAICQMIYHCSTLNSLFIHYNLILAKGGK
jgi:Ran GTPase-activating protein (RanGAP) involved in mRNA processing and transport